MSDYHILVQAKNKKSISAVFHVSVPATGTNEAGISWRDAVVLEQGGQAAINSILSDVTGMQEETEMKAGALIEVAATVRFSSLNLTLARRRQEIEAKFNEIQNNLITEKQETLAFIGFDADVS